MATFRHHIYFIKNILNKGVASDDVRINDRLIAHALKQSRTLLIKRKLERMENISDLNFQTFCLDLAPSTFHDCNCIPTVFDCQILKSIQEIPAYLVSSTKHFIELRYLQGRKIDKTSYSNFLFAQSSLASAETPTWFLYDKHVYVTNTLLLKKVLLRAIFEDPEIVIEENCENSAPCTPYDEEFPIDGDLVIPMYKLAIETLGLSYKFPEDNENNARSNQIVQDKE